MELSQSLDLVSVEFVLFHHFRLLASPHKLEYSLKLFCGVDGHGLVEMVKGHELSYGRGLALHLQDFLSPVNILKIARGLGALEGFLGHLEDVPRGLLEHDYVSAFKSARG